MSTPSPTYVSLGASGLKVSRLWLGTMMFGDQTSAQEAANIVAATRDAGLNALDTANAYAGGESERITGKLIAADRDRWVVATKLANPTGPGPNDRGLSRRHIISALEASLKRLGTDRVEVLYLHREDPTTPLEETLGALAHLIDQGKVHHFGLSNFRAWRVARVVEMCRAMGIAPPVVCQPPYSAMSRQIETELLPCCAHYGVGVVVYSPLARGVLSGKYRPGAAPPEGSRAARNDARIMQTEFRAESLELAARMAEYARTRSLSPTRLALGWVWNNTLVNGLIGPRPSPNGKTTWMRWTRPSAPKTSHSSVDSSAPAMRPLPATTTRSTRSRGAWLALAEPRRINVRRAVPGRRRSGHPGRDRGIRRPAFRPCRDR